MGLTQWCSMLILRLLCGQPIRVLVRVLDASLLTQLTAYGLRKRQSTHGTGTCTPAPMWETLKGLPAPSFGSAQLWLLWPRGE